MTQNEALRDGYPLQKVWGSSPDGCAVDLQLLMWTIASHDKSQPATFLPFFRLIPHFLRPKRRPLRRQPDDHNFGSLFTLAVTFGAFLLVMWIATKGLAAQVTL